tara:strand:+ start:298 stop:660 length:363 start_codon:yes stop_codon:yes gene_type:complete
MNYVEIIARQEELQTELNALQAERIASAQSHTSIKTSTMLTSGTELTLDLDYDSRYQDDQIIMLDDAPESGGDRTAGETIYLSVEDYNEISQFLSKYNDAIFSYMSEITKTDDDDSADAV